MQPLTKSVSILSEERNYNLVSKLLNKEFDRCRQHVRHLSSTGYGRYRDQFRHCLALSVQRVSGDLRWMTER